MTYLQGVTFQDQNVTPIDDARLYAAQTKDCILTGCDMTAVGITLTLGAGSLLIAGRNIRVPASINIPVNGATSGYARLLLTIDLTQTSTETLFQQAGADVEYSATLAGFPALTQDDINAGGTTYQAVLCVMELAPAGISGIVSRLPTAQPTLQQMDVFTSVESINLIPGSATIAEILAALPSNSKIIIDTSQMAAGQAQAAGIVEITKTGDYSSVVFNGSSGAITPKGEKVPFSSVALTQNAQTIGFINLPPGIYLVGGQLYSNYDSGNNIDFSLWAGGNRVCYSRHYHTAAPSPDVQTVIAPLVLDVGTTIYWRVARLNGSSTDPTNADIYLSYGWYIRLA